MSDLKHTPTVDPVGSPEIFLMVRAGFVLQGATFGAWCRSIGLSWTYTRKCLQGERKGPKARALVRQALDAAKVELPE